jgi:hypothetical protein
MAALGEPLKDSKVVAYLLAGLDSDYESLVMAMTTRSKQSNWQQHSIRQTSENPA